MNKKILNWLKNNIPYYEMKYTNNKQPIIYIPVNNNENKVKKYFKNRSKQIKYAANYTWLAIYL